MLALPDGGISERLPMNSSCIPLALLAVLVGSMATVARAEISADEVRRAIHDGVTFLLRQQPIDGTWPEFHNQAGGETSLCLLALLNAGVDPDDEQDATRRSGKLRSMNDLPTTYGRSLQTMVFCRADPVNGTTNKSSRTCLWLQDEPDCRRAAKRRLGLFRPRVQCRRRRRQLQLPVRPAGPVRGPAGIRRHARRRPRRSRRLATAPRPIGKAAKTPTALGAITRTSPARAA